MPSQMPSKQVGLSSSLGIGLMRHFVSSPHLATGNTQTASRTQQLEGNQTHCIASDQPGSTVLSRDLGLNMWTCL